MEKMNNLDIIVKELREKLKELKENTFHKIFEMEELINKLVFNEQETPIESETVQDNQTTEIDIPNIPVVDDDKYKKLEESWLKSGIPERTVKEMIEQTIDDDNHPLGWNQDWTSFKLDNGTIRYINDIWWELHRKVLQFVKYKKPHIKEVWKTEQYKQLVEIKNNTKWVRIENNWKSLIYAIYKQSSLNKIANRTDEEREYWRRYSYVKNHKSIIDDLNDNIKEYFKQCQEWLTNYNNNKNK